MTKLIKTQFFILLLGTLFAWGNFGLELNNWLNDRVCTTGCAVGANPFVTPCFFGALFFTLAFVLSVSMLKKSK
jgi:hypothetical protein